MTLLIAATLGMSQRDSNLPASKAMTFKNSSKVFKNINLTENINKSEIVSVEKINTIFTRL
jgi:hypothetical protein